MFSYCWKCKECDYEFKERRINEVFMSENGFLQAFNSLYVFLALKVVYVLHLDSLKDCLMKWLVNVFEGTVLEDADWEYTIEWTVCERALCDNEGSFDGLFGTLPIVWKRIFNLWRTLEALMMLQLQFFMLNI